MKEPKAAGLKQRAVLPSGVEVAVYSARAAGIDVSRGDKYVASCETHSNMVSAKTLDDAIYRMENPEEWCEECGSKCEMKSNGNTKASDRIRLSNGQVMTLGEALDAGLLYLRAVDNPPYKNKKYVARENETDQYWVIGQKLYESRGGESAPRASHPKAQFLRKFGVCDFCREDFDSPTRRKKAIASFIAYDRPQNICGGCGDIPSETITVDLDTRDIVDQQAMQPNARVKIPARERQVQFAGYDLALGDRTVVARSSIDTKSAGDYGADPVGDGTFRMVPSGDIVDFEERNRRLAARKSGIKPNGNIPDAKEDARLDDLDAYCSTLLNQLHGDDLDAALDGEMKRRGQSDAEFRKRALQNIHPDDLVSALARKGINLHRFGIREVRRSLQPNSEKRYYVWVIGSGGMPLDEGPYGPFELLQAKDMARISATEGSHDRAVSVGRDPQASSFNLIRQYQAGTGERVL